MSRMGSAVGAVFVLAGLLLAACGSDAGRAGASPAGPIKVLAVETFLADIAQNVAGSRLAIGALLPVGVDPHGYEPVPSDVAKVSESQVLIINGAGVEEFLGSLLDNAGGTRTVITASAGIAVRQRQSGERSDAHAEEDDPHFWLDPNHVMRYAQNIRDGLSTIDPDGAAMYMANTDAYVKKLQDLDAWIRGQVGQIPEGKRQLVTNHESLGYFADRYGFTVVGTILDSSSTAASPSAQELARLVKDIRQAGVRAIFVEIEANPQLARQLAQETGAKVVSDLYTHSVSKGAPAPTYIDMMKHNVTTIVNALKP